MRRPKLMAARPEILGNLRGVERVAYALGAQINETHMGKRASMFWGHHVAQPGLALAIRNRIHLEGAEHLPLDRSMILAANHRTYFDLYAVLIATWHQYPKAPYLYCPVRSTFYYDRPLGMALNWEVSGNAMYPPIFRDPDKRALNSHAVDACVRLLDWSPRVVVAMHPEGRRNEHADAHQLLPPKPGIGGIALRSRAPVLPIWVSGLANGLRGVLRQRMQRTVEPVRVLIGAPVELTDLYSEAPSAEAAAEAAKRVMTGIAAQGQRDRDFMEGR